MESKNTERIDKLLVWVYALDEKVQALQSLIDEHLLEHMIEDRNKEFDLGYPIDDEER